MKQSGELKLIDHPFKEGMMINAEPFSVEKNGWKCDFRAGLETNGASFPGRPYLDWFWNKLFGGAWNEEFDLFFFCHDQWCGEFDQPYPVYEIKNPDNVRALDWKEAAAWGRDIMKLEDPEANCKRRRHLFYSAIMLKKRLRLTK